VAVVQGLVAGVALVAIDLGGVIVDDGDHEVVAGELVPDRHLVEESKTEKKEEADEQLPRKILAQVNVRNG
jgi:hypothetical protein